MRGPITLPQLPTMVVCLEIVVLAIVVLGHLIMAACSPRKVQMHCVICDQWMLGQSQWETHVKSAQHVYKYNKRRQKLKRLNRDRLAWEAYGRCVWALEEERVLKQRRLGE